MRQIINLMYYTALTIVLGGCLAIAGNAATFIVNSSADDQNDGCGSAANSCTLREAVGAANAANDADTITIDAAVTTITLLTGEIVINTGAVTITPSAVNGLVTIDGAMTGRIFNVSANTTLNRLLLTNAASTADGGAINNNGAVLTVNDSYLTNNTATGNGGGINTNGGTVNVNRSTIGGTVAPAPATGNVAANGGGIYNLNGAVVLSNSTITGNTGGIGGGYYGFASLGAASLNSTSSTIAFNTATNGGGIAVSSTLGFNSTASINNTIVANNTATTGNDLNDNPPIAGLPVAIMSGGYNIIRNTTGTAVIAMTGDQFNVDPLILALGANGGLTPTHGLRLSPVSPAIDKGNTALTVDQRGLTRPVDFPPVNTANGTDIGAFEAQLGTTAAEVLVGGRVTTANGKSIARAVVTLIYGSGQSRTARTNPFGYYRFKDVPSGATYIFEARSKQYTFNSKVITVTEESTAVDFTAN